MPLKQLALRNCTLLDRVQELAAALELLPGLKYLQFAWNRPGGVDGYFRGCCLPTGALQLVPQLTYLELELFPSYPLVI